MEFSKSPLNQIKRSPKRGIYDENEIYSILDRNFIANVSYSFEGIPLSIPTAYGRKDNKIYLHGALKNRMLNSILEQGKASLTVTEMKDLVLAKSAFHHSINFHSVLVFGNTREITLKEEKLNALEIVSNNIIDGRWSEIRHPNEKELQITLVVELEIENASAKSRSGDPVDEEEDHNLPFWSGLLPIKTVYGEAVPDSFSQNITIPKSILSANSSNE